MEKLIFLKLIDILHKINTALWILEIKTCKPISDHIGFVIIMFSVLCGLCFSLLRCVRKDDKEHYIGLLDIFPLLSVYYLLKELPLIHPRLNLMLKTVSQIIMMSENYTRAFQEASGIFVDKPSDIVYFLYSLPLAELSKWKIYNPGMIYENLAAVFKSTRYFFGYLDGRTSGMFLILMIVLMVLFAFRYAINKKKGKSFPFFQLIYQFALCILIIFYGKNGMVLSIFSLYIVETSFQKSVILETMMFINSLFSKRRVCDEQTEYFNKD